MFAAIGAFFKGLVDTPVKAAATTLTVVAAAHVPGNVKEVANHNKAVEATGKGEKKGAMYVIGHSMTLGLFKPYMEKPMQYVATVQPAQPTPSAPITEAPVTEAPKPEPTSRIIVPDSVPQMVNS